MMTTSFDISPEKRATTGSWLYRQLFVTPPLVTRRDRDADLSGKTAIITGASGGIGLETARQLLDLGCQVILAVRSEDKGEKAQRILSAGRSLPEESIKVWKLDLSVYDSVVAFADRCKTLERLDIVIVNAGIYKTTEVFSPTGYEEDVQINYLANALLTILLLPVVSEKTAGRSPGHINLVSSDTGAWASFNERASDPLLAAFKRPMRAWNSAERYGTSKLLQQLFVAELSRRVSPSAVIVSASNPGFCSGSDLARGISGIEWFLYRAQVFMFGRASAVGARSVVHAVTTLGSQAHGQYVEDAKIQPMPPIAYTSEGLLVEKKLYEETLDEFSFAKVRDVVDKISKTR
ncbi:NAD(P)-binding protein [Hypoxylon sp. FL1284]|nr:NAD(P)-binding protein [Hypoxylon sp. FL1284]